MQYLANMHLKAGGADMLRPDLPIPDEMPPCLYELVRIEQWAHVGIPPFSGGWMEYPAYWLSDIEAAMIGRDKFNHLLNVNSERRQAWATGGSNLT